MSDLPPLFQAILKEDIPLIRQLIAGGASLTELWLGEMSALSFAAAVWTTAHTEAGKIQVCQVLLDAGAPINQQNALGATPLDDASMAGKRKLSAFLASRGGAAVLNPLGLSNSEVNQVAELLSQGEVRANLSRSLGWCLGLLAVTGLGLFFSSGSGPEWPGLMAMVSLLAGWIRYLIMLGEISRLVPQGGLLLKLGLGVTAFPPLMPVGLLAAGWALYATRDER